MEKYFGNSYRGDPGVPHCDEDAFSNVWLGSMGFGVYAWNFPYFWTLARARNWHDMSMVYEQYHWKKTRKTGKPYEFLWNKENDREIRDSYYFNWPIYFK